VVVVEAAAVAAEAVVAAEAAVAAEVAVVEEATIMVAAAAAPVRIEGSAEGPSSEGLPG
jgi:hypothetical protein